MKRIFGRVLVKETNLGVPDLVVAVFDVDPSGTPGGDPPADTGSTNGAVAIVSTLQNRLGSILTDASGAFDLPISEETPQHYGTDQTPDLVLAVLAPEDSVDAHNPFPRPFEERLLYLSRSPRAKAGPVEAYLIRITQAQLDAFDIPAVDSGTSVAAQVTTFTAALERQANIQQELKQRLAPALQGRVDRALQVRADAKKVFANLASLRSGLRDYPYLVKDARDLQNATQVQQAAIQAGLTRLANYRGPFALRLREDELADLGLKKDDSGAVTGKVASDVMAERLLAPSAGPDLVRKRTLLDVTVSPDQRLAAAEALYKAADPAKTPNRKASS